MNIITGSKVKPPDTSEISRKIEDYYDRLYRNAWLYSGNAADAEDITQETCLIAFQNLGMFRGDSSLYSWLYGILLNVIKRRRKNLQKFFSLFKTESFERTDVKSDQDPVKSILHDEKQEMLYKAVRELPARFRTVIIMRHFEEMNYSEMAQLLNCSEGTVKSRLHYARIKLRKNMEAFYE